MTGSSMSLFRWIRCPSGGRFLWRGSVQCGTEMSLMPLLVSGTMGHAFSLHSVQAVPWGVPEKAAQGWRWPTWSFQRPWHHEWLQALVILGQKSAYLLENCLKVQKSIDGYYFLIMPLDAFVSGFCSLFFNCLKFLLSVFWYCAQKKRVCPTSVTKSDPTWWSDHEFLLTGQATVSSHTSLLTCLNKGFCSKPCPLCLSL